MDIYQGKMELTDLERFLLDEKRKAGEEVKRDIPKIVGNEFISALIPFLVQNSLKL